MLMRVLLGVLAATLVVGTGFLVFAASRGFALEQMFTGGPLTATAAAGLFGLVFIVVGAGAAVRWLSRRIFRRRAEDREPRSSGSVHN